MQTITTKTGVDIPRSMPATAKVPDIASASVPDTLAALRVNPETGSTQAEVDARRKEHGYNEVAERMKMKINSTNFRKLLWRQNHDR